MSEANSALRCSFRPFANPPIGEALPADLLECRVRALGVRRLAMREAEIEFAAIALQMRLGNVVIRSDQSALQKAEEGFNGVRVRYGVLNRLALARVFLL